MEKKVIKNATQNAFVMAYLAPKEMYLDEWKFSLKNLMHITMHSCTSSVW